MDNKKVSEELKREAVKMVLDSGLSRQSVAQQLGIGQSTIDEALAVYRNQSGTEELNISEREELKKLRRDNAELRMERNILKKATAYFARVHV